MLQTVFVIDDDEPARESLTFLLRAEGMSARSFVGPRSFLAELHPDHQGCVVTDIRMPEMDGVQLIRALNERGSSLPVIVVTGHADVPLAVECMKAGVIDFIEKPYEAHAMLRAVRAALDKAHARDRHDTRMAAIERRRGTLTERERQVLDLVVEGRSNKEVAHSLGISPRTVEIYRANVMSKMQAESLSDLVRMSLTNHAA